MPRITAARIGAGGTNVCAFLDTLAFSEGTRHKGDNGYNVMVGGTLLDDYGTHPGKPVWLPRYKVNSTAAGRYQFLRKTWANLVKQLSLPSFEPIYQDLGAIELIRGRKALEDVKAGRFDVAVAKCAKEWASLPGAGYGQREIPIDTLQAVYVAAGGQITQ
ncbi:MAG TPA: glycoside hydrolase family 104 protein [Lysobacter sp.]